jgi:hypothetical protein
VLRRISGPKRDEITDKVKMEHQELLIIHLIRLIISRKLKYGWTNKKCEKVYGKDHLGTPPNCGRITTDCLCLMKGIL